MLYSHHKCFIFLCHHLNNVFYFFTLFINFVQMLSYKLIQVFIIKHHEIIRNTSSVSLNSTTLSFCLMYVVMCVVFSWRQRRKLIDGCFLLKRFWVKTRRVWWSGDRKSWSFTSKRCCSSFQRPRPLRWPPSWTFTFTWVTPEVECNKTKSDEQFESPDPAFFKFRSFTVLQVSEGLKKFNLDKTWKTKLTRTALKNGRRLRLFGTTT